jgi:iodotyrosine deiodinase
MKKSVYRPVPHRAPAIEDAERLAASIAFLRVMQRRRSIRHFSRKPVAYELIDGAIRAAALAPSGANQQPWTFVVVSDPEVKRRIRLAAEEEERESYEHRMTPEWLEALAPLGTDWRKPFLEDAPYLVVVFEHAYGLRTDADGSSRKVKHYYVRESVGIAVGFLIASLTHAGLATLTHTPSPMGFLAEILGRPPNERAYVLIPVGHAADNATVPAIEKKPLDEVLVRFGD